MENGTKKEAGRLPTDGYMTVSMVAKQLNISRFTLYYWISRRMIPHYRVGKRVMFSGRELKAWMDGRKIDNVG